MTVYVVVDLFQGVVDEVKTFLTRESAEKAEQEWLKEQGITNEIAREGHAQNGTELIVHECEVMP